jgi:NitT/TauT family transport system permease protein
MSKMDSLFALRNTIPPRTRLILEISGVLLILLLWIGLTAFGNISQALLPTPQSVLFSFKELHFEDALVRNLFFSIKLNVLGYLEAIAICIPLGFLVALFPLFNGAFSRHINAIRFLPITALTGLFIAWFGIDTNMKVQFLAFGIVVYLLPVVVQRVSDLDSVYQQTAFTLGASKWQMIRTVFIPGVLPKLSDDIRVLTAISWTYIIVAELVNRSGGIGALIYSSARQSRIDKVFALLVVIVLLGFVQDKILSGLDRLLFPHKYLGSSDAS